MKYTWKDIREKCVIYEDDAVLAINKPVGISVVGDSKEADLVTLARESGAILFPAHRIDKETSGIILFAKTQEIHAHLTRQFNKRTIDKVYLAVVKSHGLPEKGTIALPLSIGRKNKVRVAANRSDIMFEKENNRWFVDVSKVLPNTKIYPSTTKFLKIYEDAKYTLIIAKPLTGRRHQIRVHLAWIGHPIIGDPLFEKEKTPSPMLLHAWKITFATDWSDNKRITLEAKPYDDFWKPIPHYSLSHLEERANLL